MTPLEDLLQQSTVKITVPGGWGTGFFVAPGLILTCAHVVRKAADLQVSVSCPAWQQPLSAIVKAKADDGKTLDLALVELSEPLPDHPCVLLDEEPVAIGQALYSYGYLESYTNAAPVHPVNEGLTGDTPPLLKLQGAQIEKGISGAALLNLKTGTVCGMVKETRAAGFDLGGGAIPTRVILEQFPELRDLQQVFHRGDRRWSNLLVKPTQAESMAQNNLGSSHYQIQIGVNNTNYIGETHIHNYAASQPDASSNTEEIGFQPYREAVICHYSQQRHLYTPTDALLPLEARSVERQAQDDRQKQQPQKTVEQFPVLEGLQKYALGNHREHVLLAGRPGSGKSTTLRQLAVSLAEEGQVPVLVQLKRDRPVLDLIQAEFRRMKWPVTSEQVDEWLLDDRLVLLLDGVNEIPNDDLRQKLAQFREDNPTVPMIFTIRDLSLGGDLGIDKRLEMKSLSQQQMREFVGKYLPEQGDRLLGQLRDRLRELAETPLLLKLLCDVFDPETNQIPQNRGELFQWFDRDYKRIKKEIEYVPVSENFWEFKSEILQYLAFSMIQGEVQTTDLQKPPEPCLTISKSRAEEVLETWLHQRGSVDAPTKAKLWLKDLCNHHLLQDAAKPDEIEFHHQLFQEYYAAEHLLTQLRQHPEWLEKEDGQDYTHFQNEYLNYLKWREPIALMLGLVSNEAIALNIVGQALDVDWRLGARLAGEVKQDFHAQTVELVEKLEAPYWLKAQLLGETRSEYVINSLKVFLTYQNREIRVKSASALGEIVNNAAIRELLHATYDEDESVRGEVANSLGKIGTELAGLKLKEWKKRVPDETLYVDIRRQTALWNIFGDSEKPDLFREIVVDDDFDQPDNLSYTDPSLDFHTLERAANDEIPQVRQFVAGELRNYRGSLYEESVVDLLTNFISDPDSFVRQIAFRELQNYLRSSYQNRVVNVFQKIMKNSTPDLRVQAVERLQDYSDLISKKEASSILTDMANDSSFNVRLASIRIIEKMPEFTFLPVLHQALNDEKEVRQRAAKALGKIPHKDSVQTLIQAMTNYPNDNTFVNHIIKALGRIGGSLAVEALGRVLLENRNETVKAALEALGDTKHPLAAQFLLKANFDSQQSSSSWLELQRIKALGETAGGDLLLTLIKSLKIASEQDCSETLSAAIVSIQNRCQFYNYGIFQAHLAAQKADRQTHQNSDPNAITIQTLESLTIMTDKAPIFNQQHATIGVNYAAEGSKIEFTQHTNSSEQTFEILLTNYQQFIQQLQQKYPTVADPTTVPQIIEVEAKLVEAQDQKRWQNFLNLKRLWNGGKKAAIKVGEHFVESNPWGKGAIAFLEGVSEDGK